MRPSMTGQYFTPLFPCLPFFLQTMTNPPVWWPVFQVPELFPRLSCFQSDCRQDTPPAGRQLYTRGAAGQNKPEHQSKETSGPTVQLVSTYNSCHTLFTTGGLCSTSCWASKRWIFSEMNAPLSTWSISWAVFDILFRAICRSCKLFTLSICCSSVTMRMKIIFQKHLRLFPLRVQERQDRAAHWTNRYSHRYTRR